MAQDQNSPMTPLLSRDALRRMAGARSFERGEDYFAGKQVRALAELHGVVTATVLGTRPYRVQLSVKDADVTYACTCPVGDDGAFCKHCVAVGLAWIELHAGGKRASRKARKPSVTMDDVRAHLTRQDKRALVELLMEHAMADDRLRERLLMKAAKGGPKGLDLATFRAAIDNAVHAGDFVDYRSMHGYAQGIEEVIETVTELLKEGHAAEVIELTEHALAAVEEAIQSVDDSDGHMGGIFERLQEIHHAACEQAKPDPEVLAERLFAWGLRTDWDTFYGAAARYADVLGEKGLAMYRQLAETEWACVPVLKPGRDDSEGYGKRFRITHIMETLARQSGDTEALVAIKSRDLSHAYAYLRIAEIYKQARQHDQALEWAERGVRAFPQRTDSRLREFLADEYHRRKRYDEAMALIWAEFCEAPDLDRYQKLKAHADRIDQWTDWRQRALALTRETIAKAKRETRRPAGAHQWAWAPRADHSTLVRIFLWEKDIETAWREAQDGGCSPGLWMELAAQREKDHPEDAVPIYQAQIEPTLARKNNDAYQEAIGLLRKVNKLMTRLGRRDEFVSYLATIRAAHKPKRNFMKLVDAAKWG